MRLIVSLLILAHAVWAYNYNDILLNVQSRIYPKILLLEENFMQRHQNRPVVLTVVHEKEDDGIAAQVVQKINEIYGKKLGDLPFVVENITFDDIDTHHRSDAYYLLKGSEEDIKKAVQVARKQKVPVFVYDFDDLAYGGTIALTVRRTTVIYMNRKAMPWIPRFNQALYAIVRFIDV